MHYLRAYRMWEREEEELQAFDDLVDEIGMEACARLAEIMNGLSGTRTQRYRSAQIACALVGIVGYWQVRGLIRASEALAASMGVESHA